MRKKLLSLVVTLVTLFAGVSSASAYDWQGNEVNTTDEFYLYNVGFKCFLTNDGQLVSNPESASKWRFSATSGTTSVTSGDKGLFFAMTLTFQTSCGVDTKADDTFYKKFNFDILDHETVSGAYAFSYDYAIIGGGDRTYFNVENKTGNINCAENFGESDAWLLIDQAQVDEYEKELEAWEDLNLGSEHYGEFYLYNLYTGKYLQVDASNNNRDLVSLDDATLFTFAKETTGNIFKTDHDCIKLGNKYFALNKGNLQMSGSRQDWTFTWTKNGYRIHTTDGTNQRYINANENIGDNGMVNFPKGGDVADVRRTYWILVSAEEVNIRKSLTITIPESGYTTYSNKLTGVKLVDDNYIAYASTKVTENDLYFTSITAMPSAEGAFVKGTPGTWRLARAKNATANEVNYLKAGDGATHPGAYVLASATGYPLGFYLLNDKVEVPEGKAYLEVSGASAKGFVLDAANIEQATAISAVIEEGNTTDAYSVMGTKVGSNYKGIVIKNGKKFFQK